MITGILLLIFAGMLQGIFFMPLSYTKGWAWEQYWLLFSFFGMIVLNWLLAFLLFPRAIAVYHQVPFGELLLLFSFGLSWGIGAILFGLGMQKLGMGLGYPIIMGLIAGAGTLLPLLLTQPKSIFTGKGLGILAGCGLIAAGIRICSKAAASKQPEETLITQNSKTRSRSFTVGMVIAILAGLLSALPNIGLSFAIETTRQAILTGVPPKTAGNLVWLLFFSFGFLVNAAYTLYHMARHRSFPQLRKGFTGKNVLLTFLSASCWIGSFYLYGLSAPLTGKMGAIFGWPLFIVTAIITGNLLGLWKGEWKQATPASLRLLRVGILVLLLAVGLIGLSNFI